MATVTWQASICEVHKLHPSYILKYVILICLVHCILRKEENIPDSMHLLSSNQIHAAAFSQTDDWLYGSAVTSCTSRGNSWPEIKIFSKNPHITELNAHIIKKGEKTKTKKNITQNCQLLNSNTGIITSLPLIRHRIKTSKATIRRHNLCKQWNKNCLKHWKKRTHVYMHTSTPRELKHF